MDSKTYAIHWFRRDLRVKENRALSATSHQFRGNVLGFFCFDPVFLSRSDFSPDRFGFFLHTLVALRDKLRSQGGDLLVLDHGPDQAFEKLFALLQKEKRGLPKMISFNRDYEPFARDRDSRLERFFFNQGVEVSTGRDHLILEPGEVLQAKAKSYSIYTPFSSRWLKVLQSDEVQSRLSQKIETPIFRLVWDKWISQSSKLDVLEKYVKKVEKELRVPLPKAGEEEAEKVLHSFKSGLTDYPQARNLPAVSGTSHFSIYLKNGSLTTEQILRSYKLKPSFETTPGIFLRQLVWREFFYQFLWFHPEVEHVAYRKPYRNIQWENRKDHFDAWKQGRTGFPIVDAGMRQLNQTGWMHNRLRMITASFLVKDLLVDWRWGERYFMERLLDGDLAMNNGGWQWAASTGGDAQPYFRIFNPSRQALKFDPKGKYLRTYIPELASESSIHESSSERRGSYPPAIVVHDAQKQKALALFKNAH